MKVTGAIQSFLIFSTWHIDQVKATAQARVTHESSIANVRCDCPLDDSPYPSIVNEWGFCSQFENEGFNGALLCDDADLQCDTLLRCWGSYFADESWRLVTSAGVSKAGPGMSCSKLPSSSEDEQSCAILDSYPFTTVIGSTEEMESFCDSPDVRCAPHNIYIDGVEIGDALNDGTPGGDGADMDDDIPDNILPRCSATYPSGGNDDVWLTKNGDYCATLLHSADFRSILGNLWTYSVEVTDFEDCSALYTQAFDGISQKSGTCKSYYIAPGVACLSGCDDPYDCYVSEQEEILEFPSCVAASGVETDPPTATPSESPQPSPGASRASSLPVGGGGFSIVLIAAGTIFLHSIIV